MNIMIVEDRIDMLTLLELNLTIFGYDVNAFSDPGEAIYWFKRHTNNVDLVITDYDLDNDKTGYDVIREVRSVSRIPTILLSGSDISINIPEIWDSFVDKAFMNTRLLSEIKIFENVSCKS